MSLFKCIPHDCTVFSCKKWNVQIKSFSFIADATRRFWAMKESSSPKTVSLYAVCWSHLWQTNAVSDPRCFCQVLRFYWYQLCVCVCVTWWYIPNLEPLGHWSELFYCCSRAIILKIRATHAQDLWSTSNVTLDEIMSAVNFYLNRETRSVQ